MNCKNCGVKANSELCFRCKPKKPLKRTRLKQKVYKIAARSKTRAKQEKEYSVIRKEFLSEFPNCEVEGCKHEATQIHHQRGRIGELLTDKRYFLAVCHECHERIEKNPIWAKERGYSESRLKKL